MTRSSPKSKLKNEISLDYEHFGGPFSILFHSDITSKFLFDDIENILWTFWKEFLIGIIIFKLLLRNGKEMIDAEPRDPSSNKL